MYLAHNKSINVRPDFCSGQRLRDKLRRFRFMGTDLSYLMKAEAVLSI